MEGHSLAANCHFVTSSYTLSRGYHAERRSYLQSFCLSSTNASVTPSPTAMDVEAGQDVKGKRRASVQSIADAKDLAELGHVEVLVRKFDLWSMLALAFCVLGTWYDISCTKDN